MGVDILMEGFRFWRQGREGSKRDQAGGTSCLCHSTLLLPAQGGAAFGKAVLGCREEAGHLNAKGTPQTGGVLGSARKQIFPPNHFSVQSRDE